MCASAAPRTRPDAVAADKAYSSPADRAFPRRRRIGAAIPDQPDQAANRRNALPVVRGRTAGGREKRYSSISRVARITSAV